MAWSSDVKVALEFENNVTNTGSGAETITNVGSIPFSSTIVYNGSYSGGIINGVKSFTFTAGETFNTVQIYNYMVSAGKGIECEIWNKAASHARLYDYSGGMYFVGDTTQIGPFSYSQDAWHLWLVNWSAGTASLYMDGVLKGTIASQQPVNGDVIQIGNLGTTAPSNSYVDTFICSTSNSGGIAITPTVTIGAYHLIAYNRYSKSRFKNNTLGGL